MTQINSETKFRNSVINVAWAAHKGAGAETGSKAEEFMQLMLPPGAFRMTDQQPDIILFMSGGSERKAISMIHPGHPVLLLSIKGNNAYAAATEVMAWTVNNGCFAVLSDATEASETGLIVRWCQTVRVWTLDRAFIVEGKVTGHPGLTNACRTQVKIELPPQSLALLRTRPLGNHLLMSSGRYAELLRLACDYKRIKVIE